MVDGVVWAFEVEELWLADIQLLHVPDVGMKVRTTVFVFFFCYHAADECAFGL